MNENLYTNENLILETISYGIRDYTLFNDGNSVSANDIP